jgi:hypothetical protein
MKNQIKTSKILTAVIFMMIVLICVNIVIWSVGGGTSEPEEKHPPSEDGTLFTKEGEELEYTLAEQPESYIISYREGKVKTISFDEIVFYGDYLPVFEKNEPVAEYNGIREGDIIIGEATHYCAGVCCNKEFAGMTANGNSIKNGVQCYTAGTNWLPFGAVIEIGGVRYTVRDRGGSWFDTVGNIDIFVPEGHRAAQEKGRLRKIEITIIYLPEGS